MPSLVLGCEKSNPSVHKNYSMLYSSHISWSSPTTPTPLELYPALAFDRLFKDAATPGDKSVLDAVLADCAAQVSEFRAGKEKVMGFLVGQVMKRSGGKANPSRVQELLKRKLSS